MATAIKHPHVPDRVKPSFVIFDIRALRRPALSVRVPGCQKLRMNGLTRSGTGCFIAVPIWQQWASKGNACSRSYADMLLCEGGILPWWWAVCCCWAAWCRCGAREAASGVECPWSSGSRDPPVVGRWCWRNYVESLPDRESQNPVISVQQSFTSALRISFDIMYAVTQIYYTPLVAWAL